MMSQTGLPTSGALVKNLTINQRIQLLEKLPSINELKKIRALSIIDLHYGDDLEVTTLIMSYVFLQLYQDQIEGKIHQASKQKDNQSSQMKNQAINSAVSSIKFVLANPVPTR